ncbi:MAG TPA: HAMP domain-containing sensor histidine kinase [Ohtaekwangia sp.]
MNLLYTILYSGHHFVKSASGKRGVVLSNALGVILFAVSIILSIPYYFTYGWNVVTAAIPTIGALGLFAIVLNRIGLTNTGRTWVSLFIPVVVTTLSLYSKTIYYERQEELDYFTFRFFIMTACAFPWILFSFNERRQLILSAGATLLVLMLFDPLHHYFDVPYRHEQLSVQTYYFTNVVILISYFVMVGSLASLKWVLERNERRNLELIGELNDTNKILLEKNAEIEAQTAELMAQSEVLQLNQKQLLDAYEVINVQKSKLQSQNKNLSAELLEKNKDLTETNSELIKHNNELRQFSYTVSHNLRGPVASLLGLVELLDSKKLNTEDAEVINHIKTSSERLDTVIKDLTKIIDIRHDIFQIRQRINLEQELADVLKMMKKDIDRHGVSIVTRLADCKILYSVKPMVHSILYNLINNAIKYRSTERNPVIEISTKEEETHYLLEVKDNGLGIDLTQNQENLFKLYKRFHFHTEGKGIGLYLVKLQVEALGGTIEINSEVNRFTRFIIRLRKPENIQRQILYHQPHAEIFYDGSINSTGVVWRGPVTSEQYRNVFQKCLEFVKVYNTPNYIADISQQGVIEPEDQQWMFSTIFPDAAQNGLRKIAAVRPDATSPLVQQYLQGINEHLKRLGINQEYFLTMEEAVDWIQIQNEKAALKTYNHGNTD